tara:strand:- start:290 stop:1105 length:816 start_codon:yes stop_codon:yes gene_type:complete
MVDKYLVIGNPISQSKSPQIHSYFSYLTGEKIDYKRLLVPLENFEEEIIKFKKSGGLGANITIPFKKKAFEISDYQSNRVKLAEAANVLSFKNNEIFADNTDGVGLVIDMKKNANVDICDKSILLIGAGGAAQGVVGPLLDERPSFLVISNRTLDSAEKLKKKFANKFSTNIETCKLNNIDSKFDIIINATSSSLNSNILPISNDIYKKQSFVLDMMYSSQPTLFLQNALKFGAIIRDGLGMLIEQAAESFLIWRGVRPETKEIYNILRGN